MTAQLPLFERRPQLAGPALWPFCQSDRHFSSGVNHPGEVRGLSSTKRIGVTVTEVTKSLIDELAEHKYDPWIFCSDYPRCMYRHGFRLFVDSGAFSEVRFGPQGRQVVKPITDADWRKRLAIYFRLTRVLKPRQLYLVAPDAVGDQDETLRRLQVYVPQVRKLVKLGANVIVPVQKGALPMINFWWRALEVLGIRERDAIAGIPMKKDATRVEELEEFAAQLGLWAKIHLLGLGPASKRYQPALSAIWGVCEWCEVTSDSVTLRAMVGRSNGRQGGPRALTAARDRAVARGVSGATELKTAALVDVGQADYRRQLQAARRAGWFDPELESAPGVPFLNEDGTPCLEYGPGGPFGEDEE